MTNTMDIVVDQFDALGQKVLYIYGRKAPVYAVYGANRRVMICYADASDKADEQRKQLSPLAPLRGEIDGLIDGWRDGRGRSLLGTGISATLKAKADRYNRRVADALVVALEGDVVTAAQLLDEVKQDILKDRVATARFEYLAVSLLTALAAAFVAWILAETVPFKDDKAEIFRDRVQTVGIIAILVGLVIALAYAFLSPPSDGPAESPESPGLRDWLFGYRQRLGLMLFALFAIAVTAVFLIGRFANYPFPLYTEAAIHLVGLCRGAGAGAIGAFFSIALGIRSRTVLPDLLRTSNLLDAALRIVIGLLSGAVLVALFELNLVQVKLGPQVIDGAQMLGALMIGFVGGFSERLVPDLLDKVNAQPTAPAQTGAITRAAQAAGADAAAKKKDDGQATKPDTATDDTDPLPEESGDDGCAADHAVPDDQLTADVDLPVASGGVAKPDGSTKP